MSCRTTIQRLFLVVNKSESFKNVFYVPKVLSTSKCDNFSGNYVNYRTLYTKTCCKNKMEEKKANTSITLRKHSNPPDILVYCEDERTSGSFAGTLREVLDGDRYTIYPISKDIFASGIWKGKCALICVLGNIGRHAKLLLEYFQDRGKVFALHSDFIQKILPKYTVEDREEIAQFSYGDKWHSVEMKMHGLKDNEVLNESTKSFVEDNLKVDVLSTEETQNSPCLIHVTDFKNEGRILFSQLHLESEIKDTEEINMTNEIRLEILHKLLKDVLKLHVIDHKGSAVDYTPGYFLGDLDEKLDVIKSWAPNESSLTIQWCTEDDTPMESPSKTFIPIYLNKVPKDFNHEEYYRNLTSREIGRMLIYSNVLTSTMELGNEALAHGVAIVASKQLNGCGRRGNNWITPLGQAAITVQIWQKITPTLPLMQHIAALAVVLAIRKGNYSELDIRIKWPNDIYYGRDVKIGGIVTTASCMADDVIVSIGTGVNISNKVPTICVNSIIDEYNSKFNQNLEKISIESFLAKYCSELEQILDSVRTDYGIEYFLEDYYKYWLHSNQKIRVKTEERSETVEGVISGVDSGGWLVVKTSRGEITVAPDGNTFDMMNGLVAPKK